MILLLKTINYLIEKQQNGYVSIVTIYMPVYLTYMSSSIVHPHTQISVSDCTGSLQTDLVFILCRVQKKMYTIIPLAYYCQYILKSKQMGIATDKYKFYQIQIMQTVMNNIH